MMSADSSTATRRGRGRRAVCGACALLLLLPLAACNGGGSGGGKGGSSSVTVSVSPVATIAQLNATVQMSATVTGATPLNIAAAPTGAVRTSNVVTITTTTAHGFVVGKTVTIQGVTDTTFIGTFTIISTPSATTFTYNQTAADASSGGGTIQNTAVTWQVNGTTGGNAQVGTISALGLYTAPPVLVTPTTATIGASGAVRASNTVTITTTAAHTFIIGQVISILGVTDLPPAAATITATGAVRSSNTVTITTAAAHNFTAGQIVTISGVTDSSFNGAFAIGSVPSTTTFTFTQSAANATSGGGTASVPIGTFNGTFVVASVPSTTTLTYGQSGANATSGGGTVSSAAVQIKAISVADTSASGTASIGLDSGLTLSIAPTTATLATTETAQFVATVTGPTATTINWTVNDIAGGNATVGTISATGLYTAPNAVPAPATVTVKAQAAADPIKVASAAVTISTSANLPTLTSVWPTKVAQGAAPTDFYLVGTNFLSTTQVRFNSAVVGTPVAVTSTLLRVRIPSSPSFDTPGSFPVDVTTQGGTPSVASFPVTVSAERPALVSTSPDSVPAGSPTQTVRFNGGYYDAAGNVTATFDGGTVASSPVNSNQRDATLSGAQLGTPGLFAVGMQNAGAVQPVAAGNLAVRPTASPSVLVPSLPTGGTMPSAVAINPATGIAIVANRGSGDVTCINLATNTVSGGPTQVGGSASSAPSGVAVDSIRNVAVVANNGTNNISIVDLSGGACAWVADISSPQFAIPSAGQLKPVSVGVNSVTGLALVANENTNRATVVDLNTNSVLAVVGNVSTGSNPQVGIEPRLNWAVTTPGSAGTVTIVDLSRQSAIATGGAVRTAAASNNVTITTLTSHGLVVGDQVTISGVADTTFNSAFTSPPAVFEVTSVPSTTSFVYTQAGAAASSGGGTVIHPGVLATVALGVNVRGVSINTETHTAFLADPTTSSPVVFSLLDQTVSSISGGIGSGFSATAVNPLTNVGVAVNFGLNSIQLVDLLAPPTAIGTQLGVGTGPRAAAIDAGMNRAVIANEGSNDVTIVDLGAIRQLHILQSAPAVTLTSGSNLTLDVVGFDLSGGTVRLDGTPLATTVVSARHLTATVPAAMLTSARRYVVDVSAGGNVSNVTDLTVIQPVTVGTSPGAVTIDPERDIALVTNSGSDSVSIVDLNPASATFGTDLGPVNVGDNPQGVAVISRTGRAVVTNFGSNNASLLDLATNTVTSTVTTGTGPLGVAINPNDGVAIVANSVSNTLSMFPSDTGGTATTTTVDQRPVAIAIDPVRQLAAVAHTTQNSVLFVALPGGSFAGRNSGFQLPLGVVYDPDSDRFVVASALLNNISLVNPVTFQSQSVRVGINPTSIAHNRHSSTLVTINNASNTMSVMDFKGLRVREVLSVMGSPLFAVEIHPRTNIAVVVDSANNRILLVPLPR